MPSSDDLEMSNLLSLDGREPDEETGLTGDKRNTTGSGAGPRRRSVGLNQEVAEQEARTEEARLANKEFWRVAIINALLIGSWYFFSISITVYNKWMFKDEEGNETIVFPFPLFTTCVHMLVQFGFATLVLYFIPHFRPGADPLDKHDSSRVRDPTKPLMTKMFYLTRIGPCGAATGLDIGLGNMSFKFITLTFYTMCKSSVLGFVLLFAFIFRLEKPSWKLGGIITAMTIGVLMMVAGETAFKLLGFILVMSSSAASGFRWSLTQILLIRHPATSNPFSSIFFLAPIMFVTLLIIAIPVEGIWELRDAFNVLANERGFFLSICILLFPGCLAFLMTASEFALLQRTSVVTLSICGIFKEVLTISTASIVFKDQLTPINATGLVVTIATIAAYNIMKVRKMREDAKNDAHHIVYDQEYAPVLSTDPDAQPSASSARGGNGDAASAGSTRTGDLLESGLSISVRTSPQFRPRGDSHSPKTSPIKRPEDLE